MVETANYVEFDVSLLPVGHDKQIEVYGFEPQGLEQGELKPHAFRGRVREIEGYGKSFGELFQEGIDREPSLTEDEEMALANAYLSALRGLWTPTEEQMAYLNHKFDRVGYGNILQTIVDFDAVNYDSKEGESVRKLEIRKETDRRVLRINRPEVLVVENGVIKEVKGGDRKPKLLPATGYVGRTPRGPYDEDGFPIETWETREQAEATWPQNTEEEREFAKDVVSYSWSREEGQGKAVVARGFFYRVDGRFSLGFVGDLGCGDGGVGRSPVSR